MLVETYVRDSTGTRINEIGTVFAEYELHPRAQPAEPPATDDLVRRLRDINGYGADDKMRRDAAVLIERQAREIAELARGNTIAVQEKQREWARAERAIEHDRERQIACESYFALAERAEAERDDAHKLNAQLMAERDALREDAERLRKALAIFMDFAGRLQTMSDEELEAWRQARIDAAREGEK